MAKTKVGSFSTGKVKKTKQKDPGPSIGEELGFGESCGSFSTGKVLKRKDVPATRLWSTHQEAIFKAGASGKGSLIIEARAGTGKTTTVIELVKHLTGKILLCAFNKRIADELKSRVDDGSCDVLTLHGLGYRLVGRSFPGAQVDNMRGLGTAERALSHVGGPKSKNYFWMVKDTMAICKQVAPFLIGSFHDGKGPEGGEAASLEQILAIGRGYGHLDRLDPRYANVTAEAVLIGMRLSLDVTGTIDYDDMLFVPLHVITTSGEYDAVIVDEAQDMNAAQLYLAQQVLKKDGRLIVVGDQHQAIYGFRGADSGSMDRLKEKFKAKTLKLPVSYRCPQLVINEAKRFVPDIEAAPQAPNGEVQYIGYGRMVREASAGDFILSRLNAPLLRLCLMFIKEGRSAVVEGRDIGKGLLNLIGKMTFNQPVPVSQFLSALKVWGFKRSAECTANDDPEGASQAADQVEALTILSEDCPTIDAVRAHISRMFEDTEGRKDKIICSTVHKAKGLESDRVFILCDTFKGGWEGGTGEEANLKYVAITRSKKVLSYVDHPAPPDRGEDQTQATLGKDPEPQVAMTPVRNDFDAPF